jgi:hypothetical protein
MAMESNTKTFKTVAFEDGTSAVVRTDPREPRLMKLVAIFYDASRARDYADIENGQSSKQRGEIATPTSPTAPKTAIIEPNGVTHALSERQSAVLEALRGKMDDNNLVEVRAAVLAEASSIPLGSLHSVLGSLEKKHLILTTCPGSARAPAVYQVL